ncbi:glycoside hydrolase family 104 protein [Roseateles sp.]|uniref:glycoside hydrolase family 24 protein n=1 Tax=Roseateles sp. TaxID=1971397 RepID=UPI002E196143
MAAARQQGGPIEAAEGDIASGFSTEALADTIEATIYQLTESPADVEPDTAAANVAAFLAMLGYSEGADYSTCYGYRHKVQDFSDHPAVTGEWAGELLSDTMCRNAGFGPGCKSTAAGKYQITRPTWLRLKAKLGLADFSPESQDAAAVQLISERGALEAVKAGDVATAIKRCRNEWASLPGNYAQQGQRSAEQLVAWYQTAGGSTA